MIFASSFEVIFKMQKKLYKFLWNGMFLPVVIPQRILLGIELK